MKKLVKTAKQQFEERLSNFINPIKEVCHYSTYYLCTDEQGFCVILYSYNEGEVNAYKEFSFGKKLDDIYTDEDFLCFIVDYWSEYISSPIKELFEWYASADRENTPFSIDIILQFAKVCNKTTFEDIYEEVSDVRIITAKEQWENDSKDANTLWENSDETLKVLITDEYVKFYRLDDAITCYTYPSLEIMRNDRWFVCQIVDTLSESCEHDKISPFIKWTRSGGDFPLPISIIFNSDYQEYTCYAYEDKELPQEYSIEEILKLTPEQEAALKAFEEASDNLKRSGVMLVSYWDENKFYAINGGTQLKFNSIYDYKEGEYVDISNVLVKKHKCKFYWDLYWGVDCCFCAKKF